MKNKIKKAWKDFHESGKYICDRSSLISMVSLAYIIRKDFIPIISEAINNNLLTPYYCEKYEDKENKFLCKKQIFYEHFCHYAFYLDNYYFLLDEVINLEQCYNLISNNVLSPLMPTGDNYTTEKNITKVLNRTILKSSVYYNLNSNPYERYLPFDLLVAIFSIFYNIYQLIRALYNKRFFFKKKKYEADEEDLYKILFLFEDVDITNKNLINKDDFPMLSFLTSKDPKILENYLNTHKELSNEEQSEMVFYLSFCYNNTQLGNIIKKPQPTEDAPKQAGSRLFGYFVKQIQKRKYENPNEIFPLLMKELDKLAEM